MANEPVRITHAEALKKNYVKPGSERHRMLVEAGYQMTLEEAKVIVEEWNKDHKSWPLEEYKKAKAMLEAVTATPQVIDPEPGWHRQRG